MRVDTSKWHARLQGRDSIQNYGRIHAFELTATCLSALLVTLSLVLPSFASGVSNNQTDVPSAIAQTDDSSSSSQDSSSSENSLGGGSLTESSSDSAVNASADSSFSSSKIAPDIVVRRSQSKQSSSLSTPSGTPINNSNISTLSNSNGGTYYLTERVTTSSPIYITGNTTLDLNGYGLEYTGSKSEPAFIFVQDGATLTVTDSNPGETVETNLGTSDVTGHAATLEWNGNNPSSLTYYVTKSDPKTDGLGTTETLYRETYNPGGFIVAGSSTASAVVHVASGATFNLQGGLLTLKNAYTAAGSSIYPQVVYNAGTFDMSGGYLAGVTTSYRGGGVRSVSGSTMRMSGGVIAANTAVSGGGVYMEGGTLNISGGTISGNTVSEATYNTPGEDGYGAGVFAICSSVTVSGGYVTNNKLNAQYFRQGDGFIGGGGIAVFGKNKTGSLTISGGYITGNYSLAAGGGVYAGSAYAGSYYAGLGTSFSVTGGTVAGNVAQTGEGGGIRVSYGTTGTFAVSAGQKAYITNNKCNSDFDWGGGGVFVQEGGKLICLNALITGNDAGGYGGGVGACPTGETVVTHTQGAAIYGNTDAESSMSAHMSGGGHGKNKDETVAKASETFRTNGHADYFLVRESDSNNYITAITGRMLGEGAANWDGTIDGKYATIDANSGAQAKYMVGLTSSPDEDAKASAIKAATLTISGNYAYNHGGGIMTNGGLILGEVSNIDIYPGLKLEAKKALMQDSEDAAAQLKSGAYTFVLLSPSSSNSEPPSWNDDGSLNYGGCLESARITNDKDGNLQFTANSEYSQSGRYCYYVAELPNNNDNTIFDKTIYKISATVTEEEGKRTTLLGITFKHYTVSELTVTPIVNGEERQGQAYVPHIETSDNMVTFTLTKNGKSAAAFTNELAPYTTTGSFTPQVIKHVDGGDMKEFTFELYDESGFDNGSFTGTPLQTKKTTKSEEREATVTFEKIDYKLGLSDLDTHKRGGKKTYTYYVREKQGSDSGYTYDDGYYKIVVTVQDTPATDKLSGTLTPTAKYTYVDASGKPTDVPEGKDPTFHNKYATELPSAGQAGITIAYVAGAAALGYGVWRLVKARGKSRRGGE